MTSIKRIGTHDGCFHCDEVLAVVLLKHLPEYKNASVVRSRDPDVLSVCDVVVDVGGVYDPQTYRFDHHQKDFSLTWSKYFDVKMWDVKLSSAGLVYVHFGKRVLSLLTGLEINHEVLEKIFMRVYESFILEIDGQDNGTPQSKMPLKYNINTGLYCRVRRLNPWWNSGSEESESAFQRAINLVSREFLDTVDYFANCWWPARHIVAQAMSCREDVDPSKMIIVLDRSCPWKSHLFDLEREERMETSCLSRATSPSKLSSRAEVSLLKFSLLFYHQMVIGLFRPYQKRNLKFGYHSLSIGVHFEMISCVQLLEYQVAFSCITPDI
uniref:SJCHGC01215 protein n=1 Tax=Schistosoma japonicum TaxID=6182 RepID=Q5DCW9_SCHJA|nr:SJCHGC01215 protein [Schistosoma japonicum]